MCLSSFGVQVTSLVAILGSIGVAVGLALQGSLSHIASGIMLLIFRPFKIGDAVVAGGQTGVVNEIGLFSTTLDTPDNRRIIVPNGAIVSGVITNATHHGERLVSVQVPTDGSVSLDKARATMRAAAESVGGRIAGKPVAVALTKMDGANTWTVSAWVKTSEMDAAQEALLIACNQAAKDAGILPAAPVALVKNV
jgi:small conductance mechanosensitive channel